MVKRCFQTATNVRRMGRRALGVSPGRKVDQWLGGNAGNRLAKKKLDTETGERRQKHREMQDKRG